MMRVPCFMGPGGRVILPVVLGNLGIDEIGTQGFEGHYRALLISPDKPRVADHVSGHDGGETALHRYPPCREA